MFKKKIELNYEEFHKQYSKPIIIHAVHAFIETDKKLNIHEGNITVYNIKLSYSYFSPILIAFY